jgi:seryl-tRNA synthetase
MIDLKDLRENPEKYRLGAQRKKIAADVIGPLLDIDSRLRSAQTERENLTAEKNRIGKEIGALAGKLKSASPEEKKQLQEQMTHLQQRPTAIKNREAELEKFVKELEPERDKFWLQVPAPPDSDVPVGNGPEDNQEISTWHPPGFDPKKSFKENRGFEPRSHVELAESLGLVSFEKGVKIAGSRSYVLTGAGALLHNAVTRFAHDSMVFDNGYTAVNIPVLVREQIMVGTGFFPHGIEQAYKIANPTGDYDLYLTGTGEVGLMGLHQDEIVDAAKLPLKYVTVSTCFRREAGSAGKDTAGLYRIHQFDKVEQVVICRADEAESRAWHKKMIGFVEAMLQKLEIPYRLLQCCTADLGPKNADMIDIESWMPSRNSYGETHSASRLYDYQCRRLNTRYKDPETGKNVVCHSLNNTVAASPRILIPLLELNQNPDGSVTVPAALRRYMGGIDLIKK